MLKSASLKRIAICMGAALTLPATAQAQSTARFDEVSYRSLENARPVPAGAFRNPILPGFQPDPSIVKVGKDFYLVNSTFSWYPGLPIYHSTDLVNWKQIGNAIDRPGMMDFSGLGTNRGLFAPAISYHDGKFWIVNTCIECGDNFVITADRPEGPWSDPKTLDFGGIDPSLYFGEDGRTWILYNDAPPGEPLYEGHRAIWMRAFDTQAMQVTGEPILLINGGVDLSKQPVWAEGPHIYKVGDWYYLSTAEGGTADQHSQTIWRAKSVTGPYEPGPNNPTLTQRDLPADRSDRVEATGHADLVELDDGSWWGVFLATRPFAGQSTLMGRETFLLPLTWGEDGWPTFLPHGAPVPLTLPAPDLPASEGDDFERWTDTFDGPLGPQWIGIRSPDAMQRWMIDGDTDALILIPGSETAGMLKKPSFVGRRLRHHNAEFVTTVTFTPQKAGEFAGLLAFMDENHFLAFGEEQGRMVVRMRKADSEAAAGEVVAQVPYSGSGPVELRMQFDGGTADLAYRAKGGGSWTEVADDLNVEPLASVHAGLFTGVVVGPYATTGN